MIMEFISTHAFWQTKDNNKSEKNKKENQELTQELGTKILELLQWNKETTTLLIQYHIEDWEFRNNNILLPKYEAHKQAVETFYRYKSCGYIDEWNCIREDLKQAIE